MSDEYEQVGLLFTDERDPDYLAFYPLGVVRAHMPFATPPEVRGFPVFVSKCDAYGDPNPVLQRALAEWCTEENNDG